MSFSYFLACHICKKTILLGSMKVHGWHLNDDGKAVLEFVMGHHHDNEFPSVVDEGSSEVLEYEDSSPE